MTTTRIRYLVSATNEQLEDYFKKVSKQAVNQMIVRLHGAGHNDTAYKLDSIRKEVARKGFLERLVSEDHKRASKLWQGIKSRTCDNTDYPTYLGCRMSDNFLMFEFFLSWCTEQIGFRNKEVSGRRWAIDKDILSGQGRGKLYSEAVCCFVPNEVNMFFVPQDYGSLPPGVCYLKNNDNFVCQCRTANGKYHGVYNTALEAALKYKEVKEAEAIRLANKYEGMIDARILQKLSNFTIDLSPELMYNGCSEFVEDDRGSDD